VVFEIWVGRTNDGEIKVYIFPEGEADDDDVLVKLYVDPAITDGEQSSDECLAHVPELVAKITANDLVEANDLYERDFELAALEWHSKKN